MPAGKSSVPLIALSLVAAIGLGLIGYFMYFDDDETTADGAEGKGSATGVKPASEEVKSSSKSAASTGETGEVDPMQVIARLKQEGVALQAAGDFEGCIKKFKLLSKVQEKIDPKGGSHLWTNIMLAATMLQLSSSKAGQGMKPGEPAPEPDPEAWNLLVDSSAALHEIAVDFCEVGELEKAQGLCQQLAQVQAQLLGPAHPNVLQTLSTMGGILAYRGDLGGSRELYEAVFAQQVSQGQGGDLTSKLTALSLGHVLWQQREFEASSKLLEATEVSFKTELGQGDMLTMLVRVELALLRQAEGKRPEAEALFALVMATEGDNEDVAKQLDCFILNQGRAWGESDERVVAMRDAAARLRSKAKA
ncbi:hypothetical protein TrST_g1150 [Triparma strigata]|uniref:Uncharacterized protein n=1 Tax=Triparma strigata TaxID=1606541 RepID=A0A9W7E2T3_9STRA|nr:hypothetical protein TrST_g1150 [Triparma strigata]